jgi:tetratricopeptide (TPR) repeat protein
LESRLQDGLKGGSWGRCLTSGYPQAFGSPYHSGPLMNLPKSMGCVRRCWARSIDPLASINNLAAVLRDQGKYEQAGGMYRQELRLCKTVLGPDNPSTLTSRSTSNLALVLRDQGKYEQAEEMYRQALRLSKDMKTKPSMRRNLGR